MNPAARIGLLGGTLDPIHVGHVETALAARQALALDRVIVLPSRVPPHRQHEPVASRYHRFAMAALAVNGVEGLAVSDIELCAPEPSYTADTLERFHKRSGLPASQIFFITGADAFAEIETWHRYPEVLDLSHFVVVSRPGFPVAALRDRLTALAPRMVPARPERTAGGLPAIFLVDAPTSAGGCVPEKRSRGSFPRLSSGTSFNMVSTLTVSRHARQITCMAKTDKRRSVTSGKKRLTGEVDKAVRAALDKKASDVVVLDLRNTPAFTDFFILCSGTSTRQVKAIVDAVEETLRAVKVRPAHVEGYDRGEWVLMDYFTFIVHVFTPQTRAFYSLERLWGDAERLEISDEPA
jgi:nicotinate (nicotinamide) nucleotide adenylyltransferase/ribosome silencing factor RsfS/YbeB/iojap